MLPRAARYGRRPPAAAISRAASLWRPPAAAISRIHGAGHGLARHAGTAAGLGVHTPAGGTPELLTRADTAAAEARSLELTSIEGPPVSDATLEAAWDALLDSTAAALRPVVESGARLAPARGRRWRDDRARVYACGADAGARRAWRGAFHSFGPVHVSLQCRDRRVAGGAHGDGPAGHADTGRAGDAHGHAGVLTPRRVAGGRRKGRLGQWRDSNMHRATNRRQPRPAPRAARPNPHLGSPPV